MRGAARAKGGDVEDARCVNLTHPGLCDWQFGAVELAAEKAAAAVLVESVLEAERATNGSSAPTMTSAVGGGPSSSPILSAATTSGGAAQVAGALIVFSLGAWAAAAVAMGDFAAFHLVMGL